MLFSSQSILKKPLSLNIASYPVVQLLFVTLIQMLQIKQVCVCLRFGYPLPQMDVSVCALLLFVDKDSVASL